MRKFPSFWKRSPSGPGVVKSLDPFGLINFLRTVIGNHTVKVEGDTQFGVCTPT